MNAPVTMPGTGAVVLSLPQAGLWRDDPQVRTAVGAAVADAADVDDVDGVVRTLLAPGRYVVAVGDRRVGVSASHEAGRTYVAVATDAVALDACTLDRWDEVEAVAADVFTTVERLAMHTPWDRVRAWTALECAVKAGAADLLRPHERAPLVVPGIDGRPVVDGTGTALHLVHHAGRLRAVCVRAVVTSRDTPTAWPDPPDRFLVGARP